MTARDLYHPNISLAVEAHLETLAKTDLRHKRLYVVETIIYVNGNKTLCIQTPMHKSHCSKLYDERQFSSDTDAAMLRDNITTSQNELVAAINDIINTDTDASISYTVNICSSRLNNIISIFISLPPIVCSSIVGLQLLLYIFAIILSPFILLIKLIDAHDSESDIIMDYNSFLPSSTLLIITGLLLIIYLAYRLTTRAKIRRVAIYADMPARHDSTTFYGSVIDNMAYEHIYQIVNTTSANKKRSLPVKTIVRIDGKRAFRLYSPEGGTTIVSVLNKKWKRREALNSNYPPTIAEYIKDIVAEESPNTTNITYVIRIAPSIKSILYRCGAYLLVPTIFFIPISIYILWSKRNIFNSPISLRGKVLSTGQK